MPQLGQFSQLFILSTELLHSSYRMDDLMKFFHARRSAYHTNPKLIDEVIYTPYVYDPPCNDEAMACGAEPRPPTGDLLGIPELREGGNRVQDVPRERGHSFDVTSTEAEIFLFEYGTVVIWGMTEAQERRFLSSMYVIYVPRRTLINDIEQ